MHELPHRTRRCVCRVDARPLRMRRAQRGCRVPCVREWRDARRRLRRAAADNVLRYVAVDEPVGVEFDVDADVDTVDATRVTAARVCFGHRAPPRTRGTGSGRRPTRVVCGAHRARWRAIHATQGLSSTTRGRGALRRRGRRTGSAGRGRSSRTASSSHALPNASRAPTTRTVSPAMTDTSSSREVASRTASRTVRCRTVRRTCSVLTGTMSRTTRVLQTTSCVPTRRRRGVLNAATGVSSRWR